MKVGYARVSTSGQSLEVQLDALRMAGCDEIFQEKQSGKATDNREELQAAIKFLRKGDVLIVTRLDRLARSVGDLHKITEQLNVKEAGLMVIEQPEIDTSSKYGKLVFSILGAVAELERDLILERTNEGRLKAMAKGVKFGPKHKLTPEQIIQLKHDFQSWEGGKAELAEKYGIARASLYRIANS